MNKSSLCKTCVCLNVSYSTVQLFKKKGNHQTCFPFQWNRGESLSWFAAVQCPSALYVWLSGARPHWLPDLFGFCWSHWFSSPVPPNVHYAGIPGEERKQPDRHTPSLPGRFNYYDKPTFPQLVGNEKWKLIWRKRGWVFRGGGGIFLLLLLIVEMRGETDGEQFTGGGMSGLFLKSALVPLLFFTSDGGEL